MVKKNPAGAHLDSSPTQLSMEEIRSNFQGGVIVPDDPEYDAARLAFYGGIDHYPAVILRPRNADEVCQIVALARETGLDLSIRSGGHSVAGYGVCDGGIMLDLSDMRDLKIDVAARTAWAEAGVTAGE